MTIDSGMGGPAFDQDDLDLLREQEFSQQRFREQAAAHLLDGEVRAAETDFCVTSPGRVRSLSEIDICFRDKLTSPAGHKSGSESERQTGPSAGESGEIPLWESGPYLGYSLDELATCLAPDIFSDRLTREQRALQIAAEVAADYGWDRAGILLLAEVFGRYSWSASQAAVRRAIENGMTQKEFAIAARVRQMWSERCEFWVALSYGSRVHQYTLLTWPGALVLIRSFEGYPDVEEVERMLDIFLEQWLRRGDLQFRFSSFLAWALHRCEAGGATHGYGFNSWGDFDSCPADDDGLNDAALLRELEGYGISLSPEWQPVSRGAPRKENARLREELDISQWQMLAADGEEEC